MYHMSQCEVIVTWARACASYSRCPRTVAEKHTGLNRDQCSPPEKLQSFRSEQIQQSFVGHDILHTINSSQPNTSLVLNTIGITCANAPLAIPPHGFLALAKLSKVTLEPACSLVSLLRFQTIITALSNNCGFTWQQ